MKGFSYKKIYEETGRRVLEVVRIEEERFQKALGVTPERLEEIERELRPHSICLHGDTSEAREKERLTSKRPFTRIMENDRLPCEEIF
ncbi:MAG: hypothetical protein U9Q00_01465 [Synergistota bacterium]|nr:hypothetical protein [Synergistota bacterium]